MLKQNIAGAGVGRLSGLFGKTRQAYYEKNWYEARRLQEEEIIVEMVQVIRREMPRIGVKKLYRMLKNPFRTHGIKTGRDAFYTIMQSNDLLVKNKRKRVVTTYSRHWMKKYPNLIRELTVTESEQLWVSDITYICVGDDFNYLSLITDAYSRKILGYCLHQRLISEGCIAALEMALASRLKTSTSLIHHSDRGSQYCSSDYVNRLQDADIAISMTEKGDPYENAVAERVNGILKCEFMLNRTFAATGDAQKAIEDAIRVYNESRPHMSCNYLTPSQAHIQSGTLERRWKNYYKKQSVNESE